MKMLTYLALFTLLFCAAYSFAQDQSSQAGNQPPGTCPTAFPSCIFYGGDSDWNVIGGNKSYLPNQGPGSFAFRVFDNALLPSTVGVNGIFVNMLVNPSELSLYTSGYFEVRIGVSEYNQGVLVGSGICSVTNGTFSATPNGQNLSPTNIGVWFDCGISGGIVLGPGVYWFSMAPQATGATKPIFEWNTSAPAPWVGLHKPSCELYAPPSCAYYVSSFLGIPFVNTLDQGLPYPGPKTAGAFSWGLY